MRVRLGICVLLGLIMMGLALHAQEGDDEPCFCYPCVASVSGEMPNPPKGFDGADYVHMFWKAFIAMNWPADTTSGERGKPLSPDDPEAMTAHPLAPRVWQTWYQPFELLPRYDDEAVSLPCSKISDRRIKTRRRWDKEYPKFGGVLTDLNQTKLNPDFDPKQHGLSALDPVKDSSALKSAPFPMIEAGPLVDENRNYVRYETRFNEILADCVREGAGEGCRRPETADAGSYLVLPGGDVDRAGSVSLKASWKLVTNEEDEATHYLDDVLVIDYEWDKRKDRYEPVCRVETRALVGFHIVMKDSSVIEVGARPNQDQWIWATFEHKGNADDCKSLKDPCPTARASGYCHEADIVEPRRPLPPRDERTPSGVCRLKSLPPPFNPSGCVNELYPAELSSPWNNYRLVRFQWSMSGQPNITNRVANTTLETYTQESACQNCHTGQAFYGDFVWTLALWYLDRLHTFQFADVYQPD